MRTIPLGEVSMEIPIVTEIEQTCPLHEMKRGRRTSEDQNRDFHRTMNWSASGTVDIDNNDLDTYDQTFWSHQQEGNTDFPTSHLENDSLPNSPEQWRFVSVCANSTSQVTLRPDGCTGVLKEGKNVRAVLWRGKKFKSWHEVRFFTIRIFQKQLQKQKT